jgi:hypothetical protein
LDEVAFAFGYAQQTRRVCGSLSELGRLDQLLRHQKHAIRFTEHEKD